MVSEGAAQAAHSESTLTLGGRAARFFARVALGLAVAHSVTSLAAMEGRIVTEERGLDFPLWVALDDLGVAVLETRLTVRAAVGSGGAAGTASSVAMAKPAAPAFDALEAGSIARLKELARRAAGALPGEAAYWSDVGEGYRAVYFEGPDPAGGTWLVSGSYIESTGGSAGRLELAASRSVYGRLDDVRGALYDLERRLERAASAPLAPAYHVRAFGRPPADADAEEFARELLSRLGASARVLTKAEGEVVAFGYSPRLPGRAELDGMEVNVVVRVTERGMGPWLEVGSPSL